MRAILFAVAVLFLAGLLLGAVGAVLGSTWAILLGTVAVIWLVRAITSGRLDGEKLKAVLGLTKERPKE